MNHLKEATMRNGRMAVLAGLVAGGLAVAAGPAAAAVVGRPAPAFTGVDVEGHRISLASLKGKFVVLEWHNKGCPFVHKFYDSGTMQKLQAKWTAKGVVWLTVVSSHPGTQGFCTPALGKEDLAATKAAPTAMILDTGAVIARAYGAKTTPHMFVIDPKGVLIYNGAIDDRATSDAADIPKARNYVNEALDAAMAGRPVAVPTTRPYGCGVKYGKG